ncbi:MAG: autotransporter outer membrane beta-barrel domain-containing protein [Planctomycetaceae bacterium]|nr:autotransporter outer membrane beta-barrel domain-containing protein [Planctomycetaceae bacterium]
MKKVGFTGLVAAAFMMTVGGVNALDYLTNNGAALSQQRSYPRDFSNTYVGEPYADVMGASITIQREFRRTLPSIYNYSQTAHYQDRADYGVTGEAYADVASVGTSSAGCPTTLCAPGKRWVMWDVPFYMRDNKKPSDGDLGYSTAVSGFATGISRMVGDSSAIGLAVGYDARRMTPKGEGYHFRNRADTLHVALFGGTNIGNVYIDAYVGWSRAWNRMEREVVDAGVREDLHKDNYRDNVYSAGIKASYVWILENDTRITPSFGLDFSHVRMDAITERTHSGNGDNALRSGKSSYSNLAMPIMVSVNRTFGADFMSFKGARSLWTPEVRAGYVPVVGRSRADIDFHSANNLDYFTTKSAKFTGSYGTAGAGLKVKFADRYIFEIDYNYTIGKKYQNHSFTGMYGVSF